MQISSRTSVDWYNFIRDVCAQHFISHPAVIGGPGKETKVSSVKGKYNRGRQTDGHWVFGGIGRVSGDCFLEKVQQRGAGTLLPLIAQYIRPGSIVYSDEWGASNQLQATLGLRHQTVNHSLHFVDPVTGLHTQGIEGM